MIRRNLTSWDATNLRPFSGEMLAVDKKMQKAYGGSISLHIHYGVRKRTRSQQALNRIKRVGNITDEKAV